jgi:thioredoxin-dependent peroxiredoxin
MITLQVGDSAPDFSANDQDGHTIGLDDFKGKKLVLYFYPKDDTPGCTAQACDLRDNYERMLAQGYAVVGVSVDNEKSHQKFIKKYDLPFPLLADTDHTVVEAYGVWGEKKNYGRTYMGTMRTTFVIDEDGKIKDIIGKVNTKEHAGQILND